MWWWLFHRFISKLIEDGRSMPLKELQYCQENGDIFVSEYTRHVISRIDSNGTKTILAGSEGMFPIYLFLFLYLSLHYYSPFSFFLFNHCWHDINSLLNTFKKKRRTRICWWNRIWSKIQKSFPSHILEPDNTSMLWLWK